MQAKQIIATLYLGRNIAGKYGVSEPEFEDFLKNVVTPLFNGFTVTHGLGYWMGQAEISSVLVILAEDTPQTRYNVNLIARRYNGRFNQEAVLVSFQAIEYGLEMSRNPYHSGAEPLEDRPADRLVTVQGHDDLHNHDECSH